MKTGSCRRIKIRNTGAGSVLSGRSDLASINWIGTVTVARYKIPSKMFGHVLSISFVEDKYSV